MSAEVEARYPRAARLLRELVHEALASNDGLTPESAKIVLRFAATNSDAVLHVLVTVGGRTWRDSATTALPAAERDRLLQSLTVWLRSE